MKAAITPTVQRNISETVGSESALAAETVLRSTFGHQQFRPEQQQIIEQILKGQNALIIMPTGAGKSLCYQIPALCLAGVAIIISPLIALMQDQVDRLQKLGIAAAYLSSQHSYTDQRQIEYLLRHNQLKILYISPERLLSPGFIDILQKCQINLFAIDEAHCISAWGHDFRPEYQQLQLIPKIFPSTPRIALTATADDHTCQDIIHFLSLQNSPVVRTDLNRRNIYYKISYKKRGYRQKIAEFLKAHTNQSGLIYCRSRQKVEEITDWLCQQGICAVAYHAGFAADTRIQRQSQFLQRSDMIMVTTIAFGMGIDKPDIRFVIHIDPAKSLAAFYQESGRAGRDQQPALSWMFYGDTDLCNTDATHLTKRQKIENDHRHQVISFCHDTTCYRQQLLNHLGQQAEKHCGNCDNCTNPFIGLDHTNNAEQVVALLEQHPGLSATMVIDTMRGKISEDILLYHLDQSPFFGIDKKLRKADWQQIVLQLRLAGTIAEHPVTHGLLVSDIKKTNNHRFILRQL